MKVNHLITNDAGMGYASPNGSYQAFNCLR
jgi:hypothetical protein